MRRLIVCGWYKREQNTVASLVVSEKGVAGYRRPIHKKESVSQPIEVVKQDNLTIEPWIQQALKEQRQQRGAWFNQSKTKRPVGWVEQVKRKLFHW